MPRTHYRSPSEQGRFLEELHQPDGRVFPLGRRRTLAVLPPVAPALDTLSGDERRVLTLLARRQGSIQVSMVAADCGLTEGQVRILLARLCQLGLAGVEEKNIRPALGIEFQITRAELDRRTRGAVESWLGRRDLAQVQLRTLAILDELVEQLSADNALVLAWRERLSAYRTEIATGGRPRIADDEGTVAQYPSAKFLALIQACAGLALSAQRGETLTLRELSDRTCGHSKALDEHRRDLARAMGCALDELGVVSDLPHLSLKVPALGQVAGRPLWLDHGVPYSCLAGPTAEQLTVEQVDAQVILAVENKAVFQHLVGVAGLPVGLGCIWLHGQRGTERRLLTKLVQKAPVPVFVWTDVDVWGIYIQDAVAQAVAPYTTTTPVRMIPEIVAKAMTPQPLSTLHRHLLQGFTAASRWFALAQAMLTSNSWVEQEEFLQRIRNPEHVWALLDGHSW